METSLFCIITGLAFGIGGSTAGRTPSEPRTAQQDVRLRAGQTGACCFDCQSPPVCYDGMEAAACLAAGGRFTAGATCAELNPPCGAAVGACCWDDGACSQTTCAACGPFPNVWLGDGTGCSQCCTVAPGDPNFPNYALEGEPPCGPNYHDTLNPGCDCTPCLMGCCDGDCNCDGVVDFDDLNAFVEALSGGTPCSFYNVDANHDGWIDFDDINPFVEILGIGLPCPNRRTLCWSRIEPGVYIFGESGTFIRDGNNSRDTDWYEYDASAGGPYKKFTVKIRAEFDAEVWVIHAGQCDFDPSDPNDPKDSWYVKTGHAQACAGGDPTVPDLTLETPCLPAGVYWFVVAPQAFSGVPCGADYWIELTVQECTPIDIGPCPAGAYQEVDTCGAHTLSGCWGDGPNNPQYESLPDYTTAVPFTVCGNTFNDRDGDGNFVRDGDWYLIQLHYRAAITWAVTTEVPLMASPVFQYTTVPIPPTECDDLYFWTAAFFPAGTTPTTFDSGLLYTAGSYPFVVSPATGADNPIFWGYPCMAPEHDYRIDITITDISCPTICGGALPESEPACGPEYVDTFNGGCDAAAFHSRDVVLGNTGHCGKLGTFAVGGNETRDYDWWKVTLTGTANARLKSTLRSDVNLVWELYGGIDPDNPDCANRTMLDWYQIDACEPAATIYTPCLLNTGGGGTGVYYIRVYATETNVPCNATEGNTYKMTVALDQAGCTLCGLTCSGGMDDPCQSDPNQPETNDAACSDSNPNPPSDLTPCPNTNYANPWSKEHVSIPVGSPMPYPTGNYPIYGAKQCGRISTCFGIDGARWVDRDYFAFSMPAGKTKLYIRAKAQFRMTLRLFDTACLPITDPNGVQRSLAWDRACSLTSVQSLAGLTAGRTYWAEIVYGNGLNGTSLKEWFEGLPCPGEPYSAGSNIYEVELAGGA